MTDIKWFELPPEIELFKASVHKLKVLLYWAAKRWKTTLANTSPDPIFLCAEQGLLSVEDNAPYRWIIKNLEDLKKAYDYLKNNKTPFKSIVIDSLSEIAKVIKDNLTDKGKNKMTMQLRGNYAEDVMQTVRQIVNLDYHVVVIIHSKDVTDDSGNVVFYDIAVDWSAKNEIPRYFDTIAYCYIDKDWQYQVNIAGNNKTLCGDRSNKIEKENTPLNISEWIKSLTEKKAVAPVKVIEKKVEGPAMQEPTPAEHEEVKKNFPDNSHLAELNKLAWTEQLQQNTEKTYQALTATKVEELEQKAMDIKIQVSKADIFTPDQKKAYNKFIDLAVAKIQGK